MLDKFEKSIWKTKFSVQSFGVSFEVESDDAAQNEKIKSFLPSNCDLRASEESSRADFVLSFNFHSKSLARGFYRNDELIMPFESDVPPRLEDVLKTKILFSIAEHATAFTFLHAGAVALDDRAVLCIGQSRSGKTTLVADFVRAGALYYTDDCAIVDQNGNLQVFPKPLAIRDSIGTQREHSIESLGGRAGESPLPVAMLLFVEYNADAIGWKPQRLTVGNCVLKLMQNIYYSQTVRKNPKVIISNLERLASSSVAFEGKRGDTQKVIDFTSKFLVSYKTLK